MNAGRMRIAATLLVAASTASPAFAACNQELAVYSEPQAQAGLEFTPAGGSGGTHTFSIVFAENDVVLDGIVMWTQGVARPNALVMHACPEGDVTGAELDACTVWQGVVYAVDDEGTIGLLPDQGLAAARQLLLPDFAAALRQSSAYGIDGVTKLPWDAFTLSGCQE